MKITLEFNLPEEDCEFESAANAKHIAAVLWSFDQYLAGKQRNNFNERISVNELRTKLESLLKAKGMSWDCVIWR